MVWANLPQFFIPGRDDATVWSLGAPFPLTHVHPPAKLICKENPTSEDRDEISGYKCVVWNSKAIGLFRIGVGLPLLSALIRY